MAHKNLQELNHYPAPISTKCHVFSDVMEHHQSRSHIDFWEILFQSTGTTVQKAGFQGPNR